MPYLYCEQDGREREEYIAARQVEYRQRGESVLVVSGTLISGPLACDCCNAELKKGDRATLVTTFPDHCHYSLYHYDFAYELGYFGMRASDTAATYGAEWPDDSIRIRQRASHRPAANGMTPLCALDLPRPKNRPPESN